MSLLLQLQNGKNLHETGIAFRLRRPDHLVLRALEELLILDFKINSVFVDMSEIVNPCFQEMHFALKVFNFFFTSIFILEAAVKIISLGFLRYIMDR